MVITCEFPRSSVFNITIRVTRPRGSSIPASIGGSQALKQHIAELARETGKHWPLLTPPTDTDPPPPPYTAMAMSNSFFASPPIGAIRRNQPDTYFANAHYAGAPANGDRTTGSMPFTPNASIPPTPGSLAGRKRSRGNVFEDEEEEVEIGDGSVSTALDGSGEDATAVAMHSDAWAEEQAARPPFNLRHVKRPSVSSRKSQRKDVSSSASDDILGQLVMPPQMREATAEPLIDEATRVLGISWARMDSTEALQINKAAYSKWIQNHYPSLIGVVVWFENSALPGYLVEARNTYSSQQGFYIFSHELTEARLVTTEPAQLMPRLKLLPALHLAAPGGHIRAVEDPVVAAQIEQNMVQNSAAAMRNLHLSNGVRDGMADESAVAASEPNGICAAHSMELD
ncbi:hypothetical protein LTR78_009849 [Recurvomyces mirabilis]|uniref:Uncharacterized protein n=1 Tax=Recurvomyces mirabilis TaxID=574656 RepID=A0AAE0TNW9_9PEZI|nr:hypothetical protein LTR78_009849 [Recurvomyces mirabilis]KAK5153085.1 hypothetical protein LTS14_007729 [Recurvomyces mirabilis]